MTKSHGPKNKRNMSHRLRPSLVAAMLLLAAGVGLAVSRSSAEEPRPIPAPAFDEAAGQATSEIAILAGGCFWGVQGVFQHVGGVAAAVSGYAGGDRKTAQYEIVSTGTSGHAESVRVTFDPSRISYGRILQIYFSVAHDPTQLNRQGPDSGRQYRSTIFPTTLEQARIAKAYIDQLDQAHVFPARIVTTIESGKAFYPAEDYHQNFLTLHPSFPYIIINDLPKIDSLKRFFPDRYRTEPVLVATTKASN